MAFLDVTETLDNPFPSHKDAIISCVPMGRFVNYSYIRDKVLEKYPFISIENIKITLRRARDQGLILRRRTGETFNLKNGVPSRTPVSYYSRVVDRRIAKNYLPHNANMTYKIQEPTLAPKPKKKKRKSKSRRSSPRP